MINIEELDKKMAEINQAQAEIISYQEESKNWKGSSIEKQLVRLLHEDCHSNHEDQCGFFYNYKNTSYYDRTLKIIDWCHSNAINVEMMMEKHPNVLKSMFK